MTKWYNLEYIYSMVGGEEFFIKKVTELLKKNKWIYEIHKIEIMNGTMVKMRNEFFSGSYLINLDIITYLKGYKKKTPQKLFHLEIVYNKNDWTLVNEMVTSIDYEDFLEW